MKKIICLALNAVALVATGQQTMLESRMLADASVSSENSTIENGNALIDGDDRSIAKITGSGTLSLVFTLPEAQSVSVVNIVAGADAALSPSSVQIFGRNGSDDAWTSVGMYRAVRITMPYTNYFCTINAPVAFSQYKLDIQKVSNGGSVAELAEVQFVGSAPTIGATAAGSYSTAAGQIDYDGTLSLAKAYYDNGVMGDNAWNAWLQYDFDTPTAISGYTLGGGLASTKSSRPRTWELLASNDNENWVTLDMRANAPEVDGSNYALEYGISDFAVKTDFAAAADDIYAMLDNKFYRDYWGGKYLIAFWNKDETKHDLAYNYWWMAHAVDTYVDAYRRTGRRDFDTHARNIRSGMYVAYDGGRRDLWNSFFDDMEWMCLACLRASETLSVSTQSWFDEAKQLFDWIWNEGWDNSVGGIRWNHDSAVGTVDSKNSCSNGPAMIAAAMLYQRTGEEHYLDKAKKIYDFMLAHNIFDDGFVKDSPSQYSRGWAFTYNQGTWVGGLLELYRITGEREYFDHAVDLMDKSMASPWFSPDGIMCESGKGDGGLFKGIYVRYITEWVLSGLLDEERQTRYAKYLVENARSLYLAALLKPDMTIMANWRNRGEANLDDYCASVVLSGLFLLEGVDRLRAAGLLNDDYSVKNPNAGKEYKHYRLNVSSNFGGNNVEINQFTLLTDTKSGGIANVTVGSDNESNEWYTPAGVPVENPSAPGLYVGPGRKLLIK